MRKEVTVERPYQARGVNISKLVVSSDETDKRDFKIEMSALGQIPGTVRSYQVGEKSIQWLVFFKVKKVSGSSNVKCRLIFDALDGTSQYVIWNGQGNPVVLDARATEWSFDSDDPAVGII